MESYLYPGFHHLAALQCEGLPIWNATTDIHYLSHPFLYLKTADAPAIIYMNGLVGHRGKIGCRHHCDIKGRLRGKHYYPALLKPSGNYRVRGCDHPDIDIFHHAAQLDPDKQERTYRTNLRYVEQSATHRQFENRRRETGISKPSICDGMEKDSILGVP